MSYSCEIDESSANKESAKCEVKGNNIEMESMLLKPNEETIFHVTITNNGTIPAVLKGVTSPNNKSEDFKSEGDTIYVDMEHSLYAYYGISEEGQEDIKWGG